MAALAQSIAPNFKLKSVLVAVDFAQLSKTIVRHAAALARLYSAELYLMHVVSPDQLNTPQHGTESVEDAWGNMHRINQTLVNNGLLTEYPYYVVVREGDVWKQLRDVIERQGIELVLLGARNQANDPQMGLGTVAEQVFRYASCNVLTFGHPFIAPTQKIKRLVYPTDLSNASISALPYAIAIANQHSAQLVIVRVPDAAGRNRRNFLERVARILTTYVPEVKPEGYESFADPVNAILSVAENTGASGIIMSSEWGCRSVDLGESWWSTTYQVTCRANCPVLSFRLPHHALQVA
jgi:nucleotide-binding universal stress UspA family protein